MEQRQYELINNILRQIYEFRKKKDDYVVEMMEKYNKITNIFTLKLNH